MNPRRALDPCVINAYRAATGPVRLQQGLKLSDIQLVPPGSIPVNELVGCAVLNHPVDIRHIADSNAPAINEIVPTQLPFNNTNLIVFN